MFTWVCCTLFIKPWLEYQTWSILLCSHPRCIGYRFCTRKIFSRSAMLSRLASSIITSLSMLILTLFLLCKYFFFCFCKSLIHEVSDILVGLCNFMSHICKHSSESPSILSKTVKVFITLILISASLEKLSSGMHLVSSEH